MNNRDITQRFRSGKYDDSDLRRVSEALAKGDTEFLQTNIFQYIKRVENIDERALLKHLAVTQDPYVASQIISGLSYRDCKRADYVDNVLVFAAGKSWDEQDVARLAALLALPRVIKCTMDVKSILKSAYHSANPVVKDAALTSAQTYFGTPPEEVQWGEGDADMAAKMPTALLEWLDTEVH